ncbi:MAG: TIGR02285 family protein [Pseudomonadota bacterium]
MAKLHAELKEITWAKFHVPPLMILDGNHKGEGMTDYLLQSITGGLNGYEHSSVIMPMNRVIDVMASGKNLCHPAMLKNDERRTSALFSEPTVALPGAVLVFPAVHTKLTSTRALSLYQFLEETGMSIGITGGRSYDQRVDQIISSYKNNPKKIILQKSSENSGLFRMLQRGRIDSVIAFPFEAIYAFGGLLKPQGYAMRPIAEVDEILTGHIACTNNAWGAEVIRKINVVLRRTIRDPAYRKSITRWLSHEHTNQFIRWCEKNLTNNGAFGE